MKGFRNLKLRLSRKSLLHIKKYSLDNTIFIYTIYLLLAVFGISIFTNLIIGISLFLQLLNLAFGACILLIYWLSYHKNKFALAKILLHIVVSVCINIIWFKTDGSAGPSTVLFMAFIPLAVFITSHKYLTSILILICINMITLFSIEILHPELIQQYSSDVKRSSEIMIMTFIFLIFEIPLLEFAKEAMIKERDNAVTSEEQKTSMIASLSHEIRTPMNAILGFAELLTMPDVSKDEQQKYIEVINQNGRVLLHLLNNIINDSKLETNNIKPSISTFSVESILTQVYNTLIPTIRTKKNINFFLEPLQEKDTEITSDFTILYQILLNLTYNAIKFTEKGKITIGYQAINDQIRFKIKDTGLGIPDKLKPHIFKKFRSGEVEDEHLPMQGAGLGLAICKGLTTILRGKISYHSQENVGTEFYVQLPTNWTY